VNPHREVSVSQIRGRHAAPPTYEGRTIPRRRNHVLTTIPLHGANPVPEVSVSPEALSRGRGIAILSITALLALAAYYFVGVDEGMTSVFGKTMVIHEWVHDSRHFLGFPCH
jgi:Probable cobalt transporter subunit (CbtB)